MDYKNFYNDTTHVKPHAAFSLKIHLTYAVKNVFIESGLVEKKWFC
jgi:hypothetical protein